MRKGTFNNLKIQVLLNSLFSIILINLHAQDSSKTNRFTFSGYAEVYYSYDLGKPVNHERPSFFYSLNRHNEVNLNLGFVKAAYAAEKVRGNFAIMAGTYAQYNLATEPGLLKNIFEANVGVKVAKKINLWIDAGIMPSHIGFESAISKDCWVLTRSILAENSPYYEAGIKLGYTSKNEKMYIAIMYLNGWQKIQRVAGNNTPAWGTQLTYKPTSKTSLNWSTYIGNEQPDSVKRWRYFNNLYMQYAIHEKFGLITGIDFGMQQKNKGSSSYNNWFSPVLIARYMPSDKIRVGGRVEYYADENAVIIPTNTPNGFKVFGYSLNFDYLPTANVMVRLEGRSLKSEDKIFVSNTKPDNKNFFITGSLALSF